MPKDQSHGNGRKVVRPNRNSRKRRKQAARKAAQDLAAATLAHSTTALSSSPRPPSLSSSNASTTPQTTPTTRPPFNIENTDLSTASKNLFTAGRTAFENAGIKVKLPPDDQAPYAIHTVVNKQVGGAQKPRLDLLVDYLSLVVTYVSLAVTSLG
jgi:hypothetical protein